MRLREAAKGVRMYKHNRIACLSFDGEAVFILLDSAKRREIGYENSKRN